jgi:hypothetical protein
MIVFKMFRSVSVKPFSVFIQLYMCEIKCRIAMAEATFNKKRTLFTSTLDLELRKKLVKCSKPSQAKPSQAKPSQAKPRVIFLSCKANARV